MSVLRSIDATIKGLIFDSSMDGSMAACVLDPKEIGTPLTDDQLHTMMTQAYGKSFGKTALLSTSKQARVLTSITL